MTHYVIEGGELDREAKKRGTSIYLADSVIPMLPPSLSNGACSLHPGSPKLCLSIDIDIALDGSVGRTEVYESLIETAHRGTYEEVELDHLGHPTKLPPPVREMLSHAWSMKSIMDARRKKE